MVNSTHSRTVKFPTRSTSSVVVQSAACRQLATDHNRHLLERDRTARRTCCKGSETQTMCLQYGCIHIILAPLRQYLFFSPSRFNKWSIIYFLGSNPILMCPFTVQMPGLIEYLVIVDSGGSFFSSQFTEMIVETDFLPKNIQCV